MKSLGDKNKFVEEIKKQEFKKKAQGRKKEQTDLGSKKRRIPCFLLKLGQENF